MVKVPGATGAKFPSEVGGATSRAFGVGEVEMCLEVCGVAHVGLLQCVGLAWPRTWARMMRPDGVGAHLYALSDANVYVGAVGAHAARV